MVRDIWNRRTWLDATRPLWTDLEIDDHRRENEGKGDRASSPNAKAIIRRPGRPTGAKDSSPRRKGTASHSVSPEPHRVEVDFGAKLQSSFDVGDFGGQGPRDFGQQQQPFMSMGDAQNQFQLYPQQMQQAGMRMPAGAMQAGGMNAGAMNAASIQAGMQASAMWQGVNGMGGAMGQQLGEQYGGNTPHPTP